MRGGLVKTILIIVIIVAVALIAWQLYRKRNV